MNHARQRVMSVRSHALTVADTHTTCELFLFDAKLTHFVENILQFDRVGALALWELWDECLTVELWDDCLTTFKWIMSNSVQKAFKSLDPMSNSCVHIAIGRNVDILRFNFYTLLVWLTRIRLLTFAKVTLAQPGRIYVLKYPVSRGTYSQLNVSRALQVSVECVMRDARVVYGA